MGHEAACDVRYTCTRLHALLLLRFPSLSATVHRLSTTWVCFVLVINQPILPPWGSSHVLIFLAVSCWCWPPILMGMILSG